MSYFLSVRYLLPVVLPSRLTFRRDTVVPGMFFSPPFRLVLFIGIGWFCLSRCCCCNSCPDPREQVLGDLRLERVRDSRIGGGLSRGISGGEKRRLSIATELLTCPAMLFLDEPTTGLGERPQESEGREGERYIGSVLWSNHDRALYYRTARERERD